MEKLKLNIQGLIVAPGMETGNKRMITRAINAYNSNSLNKVKNSVEELTDYYQKIQQRKQEKKDIKNAVKKEAINKEKTTYIIEKNPTKNGRYTDNAITTVYNDKIFKGINPKANFQSLKFGVLLHKIRDSKLLNPNKKILIRIFGEIGVRTFGKIVDYDFLNNTITDLDNIYMNRVNELYDLEFLDLYGLSVRSV